MESPATIGLCLMGTGGILFASWGVSERRARRSPGAGKDLDLLTALVIGVFQAGAVFPGISRSGATIAAALALGAYRREAVTYSFLLSIPAILGGALLTYRKVEDFNWAEPLVGTLVAAVCGWWALRWLVGLVERGRLVWFALYCLLVGATVLTISL
jgi:undecaprenyl-diphosphatase